MNICFKVLGTTWPPELCPPAPDTGSQWCSLASSWWWRSQVCTHRGSEGAGGPLTPWRCRWRTGWWRSRRWTRPPACREQKCRGSPQKTWIPRSGSRSCSSPRWWSEGTEESGEYQESDLVPARVSILIYQHVIHVSWVLSDNVLVKKDQFFSGQGQDFELLEQRNAGAT